MKQGAMELGGHDPVFGEMKLKILMKTKMASLSRIMTIGV